MIFPIRTVMPVLGKCPKSHRTFLSRSKEIATDEKK